jgi:DNA-binding NtrC family response regulator
MAMRGSARRAITVDVRQFGWDRAVVATLRHSTLPWYEEIAPEIALDATPLGALKELGSRDRLSLVGQFAAHRAFLQFAGIADGDFQPAEWSVVQKRGMDCRLVRVAARVAVDDSLPVLTGIQKFASAIHAPPLDVLRQSWGRAETAYQEVDSRLRADAAADLRWLRASACGAIHSPGPEGLRTLLTTTGGRFQPVDLTAFRAVEGAIMLGERASPLERYSAIRPLRDLVGPIDALSEREIVERVIAAVAHTHRMFVLTRAESFDDSSRRVVELLLAAGIGVWIGVEGQELPDTSWFLLSPRLSARRELEVRLQSLPAAASKGWLQDLVRSAAFARYLDEGELPAHSSTALADLCEPLRSYVAAVALLGRRTPTKLVNDYLARLLSSARASDLLVDGVSSSDGEDFVFASDEVRNQVATSIAAASRNSLCRVAAEVAETHGEGRRAAVLLAEAGDYERAAQLLETILWPSAEETIRTLRALPRAALSPKLAAALCLALIDCGRYRDARESAVTESLLALIERRIGDYAPALARLDRLQTRDFNSELLRAELLFLVGRLEESESALAACRPATHEERVRFGYQRAVLANELGEAADDDWLGITAAPGRDYYAARIAAYRAVTAKNLDGALGNAQQAVAQARTVPERIDATLDLLFALFCNGRWSEARATALDALLLVEETQGDRAAGGILFLLAYLCADDGQWSHATHLLERLRRFYGDMGDETRLGELDLLAAHIDFSRARFASAERAATTVLTVRTSDQIREAAALVLDEIDWIEHRSAPLRSTGATANAELTERHVVMRARRGLAHSPLRGVFHAKVLQWEQRGGEPPATSNGSEKLMLFRAALGRGRTAVADAIARELTIKMESAAERAADVELRVLRAASSSAFPFAKSDFGPIDWRYATRNRLGQWHEIGPLPPLSTPELDRMLAAPTADWIACSERELLYIDDLSRWSSESQAAIGELFRIRAEHYRLRRLFEEDHGGGPSESIEGIVGDSPPMREIYTLIARVAKRDVPVCVLGESGTGKELVARAIHRQSLRRQKPFTAINCAALPENLIESELFGHMRGAFTGADRDRPGLVETTDGGTLFLDEIGEMPLAAQAKLLRFLQEGEFRRVGETMNRSADVRVIAATNRKLEAAVEQGRFREDLYYRVRGVEIVLPPLRDRAGDISLLSSHFLALEGQKHRGGATRLSPEAEAAFASYHWPGNIRELQNAIRAAHALAGEAKEIDLQHLPERLRKVKIVRTAVSSYQDAVARFRRDLIERSLAQANGNQNRAAAMLKISRQALAYQIRELGILVTPSKRPRV